MNHIWKLTKAGKTAGRWYEWDINCTSGRNPATVRYYSSLKKCREEVKRVVESPYEEIKSKDNYTEEVWRGLGDYCTVMNSGGCSIFSFEKVYVF